MLYLIFSLLKAYVDKAFNREILELDVKCNNHEWGCKWEGEFQQVQVRWGGGEEGKEGEVHITKV